MGFSLIYDISFKFQILYLIKDFTVPITIVLLSVLFSLGFISLEHCPCWGTDFYSVIEGNIKDVLLFPHSFLVSLAKDLPEMF